MNLNLGDNYYVIAETELPPKQKSELFYKVQDCKFCDNTRKIMGANKQQINCPRCVRVHPLRGARCRYIAKRTVVEVLTKVFSDYHGGLLSLFYPYGDIKNAIGLENQAVKLIEVYNNVYGTNMFETFEEAKNRLEGQKEVNSKYEGSRTMYDFELKDETLPPELIQEIKRLTQPI